MNRYRTYDRSSVVEQIRYPQPPPAKPERRLLRVLFVNAGLVLALPLLIVVLVVLAGVWHLLQPDISNPNNREITPPPLTEMASDVWQTSLDASGGLVAVASEDFGSPVRIIDSVDGSTIGELKPPAWRRVELEGWSREGELWVVTADRSRPCAVGFVARPPGWDFTPVPCDRIPQFSGPSRLPAVLPAGSDVSPGCHAGPAPAYAAAGRYVLAVCDRSARQFRDPPRAIYDIRVLDDRGRFVKQFGFDRQEHLTLLGVAPSGDLVVSTSYKLYRIEARELR